MDPKSRAIDTISWAFGGFFCAFAMLLWGLGGENLFWVGLGCALVLTTVLAGSRQFISDVGWIKAAMDRRWLQFLAGLGVLAVVGLGWSSNIYRSLLGITFYLTLLLVFVALRQASHVQRRQLLLGSWLVVCMFTGYGLMQQVGFANRSFWHNDLFAARFGNSNHFATLAAAAVPLGLGLAMTTGYRAARFFYVVATIMLLVALLLTRSRAAWLISCVVYVLWAFQMLAALRGKNQSRTSMLSILIACLCIFATIGWSARGMISSRFESALDTDASSLVHRAQMWRTSWDMIKDNPGGVGLDAFGYTYLKYKTEADRYLAWRAHNGPLQITAELGWLAAPLLALFILAIIIGLYRERRSRTGDDGMLFVSVSAALFIFLLHSLVDFPLRLKANLLFFTALLAFGFPAGSSRPTEHPNSRRIMTCLGIGLIVWWALVCVSQNDTQRADTALRQLEYDKADTLLARATRVMPLDGGAAYDAGHLHYTMSHLKHKFWKEDQLTKSRRALQRSLCIARHWPWTHSRMGDVLDAQGETKDAESSYLRAIELDPTSGLFRWHYANFLMKHERLAEAASVIRACYVHFHDVEGVPTFHKALIQFRKSGANAAQLKTASPSDDRSQRTLSRLLRNEGIDP